MCFDHGVSERDFLRPEERDAWRGNWQDVSHGLHAEEFREVYGLSSRPNPSTNNSMVVVEAAPAACSRKPPPQTRSSRYVRSGSNQCLSSVELDDQTISVKLFF